MNAATKAWLSDHAAVQKHFAKLDLPRRLRAGGGFCKIEGFLPTAVANSALKSLESLSEWDHMGDAEIAGRSDAVVHSFLYAEPEDHPADLGLLADAIALLFPKLVPSFSVACYRKGHCIHPHDDKAHVPVQDARGREVLHSRKFAIVYYLSKNWKLGDGGALVDLQDQAEHVPTFNTLVVFEVPRLHFVGPVLSATKRRFSLFGWFLAKGELYALDDSGTAGVRTAPKKRSQSVSQSKKRKRS